mgnify:FL=1
MICEWHLVPNVPLSNNGFSYQTHCWSTYCLAFTLSTALTTKLSPVQKSSLKNYSFSDDTLNFNDSKRDWGFIFIPTPHAVWLLFCPTCCFLNKNCLFKLLISMLSSSVTKHFPLPDVEAPIKANILMNSHPKAPAPITKELEFWHFLTNSSPNKTV